MSAMIVRRAVAAGLDLGAFLAAERRKLDDVGRERLRERRRLTRTQ